MLDFDYEIKSAYGFATREKGSKESLEAIMQQADINMYEYKKQMKQA